jgi:hypothetical protein
MAPIVDGLEKQFQGKVAVKRINANLDDTASKFGIPGVPTYVVLDSTGKEMARVIGGNPPALLAAMQSAAGK